MTAAPRTAWTWKPHDCRNPACTWWTLRYYGQPVTNFRDRQAMADYVRQHPRGPQ